MPSVQDRLCSTHAPPAFVAQNHANSNVVTGEAGGRLGKLVPFSARFQCVVIAASMLFGLAPMAMAIEPSTPLANYGRQAWGMENGLPQNTVQALVQTKDGFIWLGTEVGLVRFDGNSFQVFDKNTTPALPGNDVRCLLAASDGA
ncbi:MAG: two-component regulator propeller domain-containing protein, partial [Terracidiphilus sp.]